MERQVFYLKLLVGVLLLMTLHWEKDFYIIAPWNKVFIYNVKQQEFFEGNMQVLSSNGLEISLDVSVLYQPKYNELGLLHKTKGENYVNIVLIPQIRAVARSVVGRYTLNNYILQKEMQFKMKYLRKL